MTGNRTLRQVQIYGVWERNRHGGHWVRMFPALAYPRGVAVRKFQDVLLASVLGLCPHERRLMPVGHVWRQSRNVDPWLASGDVREVTA
jgi:hypothetical protein